jgi:twitching motility protein PilT
LSVDRATLFAQAVHQIRGKPVSTADLLDGMRQMGASDMYLQVGVTVRFKKAGKVLTLEQPPLAAKSMRRIMECFLGPEEVEALKRRGAADLVHVTGNQRYRVHFARGHAGPYAAIRVVGDKILPLDNLGLPYKVRDKLLGLQSGLLLIVGSTDAGKTVTCTSLLDHINRERDAVILTLEDPIEHILVPQKSMVIQREVGLHVPTFAEGIRSALRENVDVIFVGEMRDAQTMDQAMRAAETGHLVVSTLHAEDVLSSIGRIVGSYPQEEQPRVRHSLAATLAGVVYQRLLPKRKGEGRVPAVETLWTNTAVRTILRAGDFGKITSYIGRSEGSLTYRESLADLRSFNEISEDTLNFEVLRLRQGS